MEEAADSEQREQRLQRRRKSEVEGAAALSRIHHYDVADELDGLSASLVAGVGGLARSVVYERDCSDALNLCAGADRHASKTERHVRSMEAEMIALCQKVELAHAHMSAAGALRQQLDDLLA